MLRPGPKSIQRHLHILESDRPDIVFLQIGGNDLTGSTCDPQLLARDLMQRNVICSSEQDKTSTGASKHLMLAMVLAILSVNFCLAFIVLCLGC